MRRPFTVERGLIKIPLPEEVNNKLSKTETYKELTGVDGECLVKVNDSILCVGEFERDFSLEVVEFTFADVKLRFELGNCGEGLRVEVEFVLELGLFGEEVLVEVWGGLGVVEGGLDCLEGGWEILVEDVDVDEGF
jgi:hypothetical protein